MWRTMIRKMKFYLWVWKCLIGNKYLFWHISIFVLSSFLTYSVHTKTLSFYLLSSFSLSLILFFSLLSFRSFLLSIFSIFLFYLTFWYNLYFLSLSVCLSVCMFLYFCMNMLTSDCLPSLFHISTETPTNQSVNHDLK